MNRIKSEIELDRVVMTQQDSYNTTNHIGGYNLYQQKKGDRILIQQASFNQYLYIDNSLKQ